MARRTTRRMDRIVPRFRDVVGHADAERARRQHLVAKACDQHDRQIRKKLAHFCGKLQVFHARHVVIEDDAVEVPVATRLYRTAGMIDLGGSSHWKRIAERSAHDLQFSQIVIDNEE